MANTTKRHQSHWRTTQGGIRPPRYATPPPIDHKLHVEPLSPLELTDYKATSAASAEHQNWHNGGGAGNNTYGLGLDISGQQDDTSDIVGGSAQYRQSTMLASGAQWSPQNAHLDHFQGSQQGVFSPPQTAVRANNKSRGHHRSGSTIDTLATVALATSPTFAHSTPVEQGTWSRTQSVVQDIIYDGDISDRPAKRAKSEKLPSPVLGRKNPRPATSHVGYDSTMRNDAELLLNFARPATNNSHWTPFIFGANNLGSRTSPPTVPTDDPEQPPHSPLTPPPLNKKANPSPRAVLSEPKLHSLDGPDESQDNDPKLLFSADSSVPYPIDPIPVVYDAHGQPHLVNGHHTGPNLVASSPEANAKPAAFLKEEAPDATETTNTSTPQIASQPIQELKQGKNNTADTICPICNQYQVSITGVDSGAMEEWIGCHGCDKWYHCACVGFRDAREVQSIDKFICKDCEPTHGQTTYVRKSSRARAMVDYAGLNEGFIQPSSESTEHLYITLFKENKVNLQPDNFARMRPELVTQEHLERAGGGWTRPIVIPAEWNPRSHRHARNMNLTEHFDRNTSPPFEAFHNILDDEDDDDDYESDAEYEEVADLGQDRLGMVIPKGLTVPIVSELIGPDDKILDVIDVKSQAGESKKWTLRRWAEYYESQEANKTIRNVISLEVSKTKLGRLIQRPKVVRDIDLQDNVWPAELQANPDFPAVQFYCLMSVADCYTDFHVDFGGSSVYYHIVKGKKTFFFIPPEDKNLKRYQDWCNSETQNSTWLGDICSECRRIDLSEGDTMLIPSGWIHAVWTPEDSLVIGGNFLTRTNYEMQLKVWQVEKDTGIAQKFRYPFFQKIMWYAAIRLMEDDPVPDIVIEHFQQDPTYQFPREKNVWQELDEDSKIEPGTEYFNARYYSQREVTQLPALRDYLLRTARIATGRITEGIKNNIRDSVKKSIPKGYGDPMELMKAFGLWCAWKTGNVTAPEWTTAPTEAMKVIVNALKKTKPEPPRLPPERQSPRVLILAQAQADAKKSTDAASDFPRKRRASNEISKEDDSAKNPRTTPKTSGLGPKRVACDACRKRRIRCRHKEDGEVTYNSSDNGTHNNFGSSIEVARNGTNTGTNVMSSPNDMKHDTTSGYGDIVPLAAHAVDQQSQPAMPTTPSTLAIKKPGRTKACEECRKSKRRCVHDENGQVDLVKLHEPSKPRGSVKRASGIDDKQGKKAKRNSDGRDQTPAESILVEQARSALTQADSEQIHGLDNDLIDPSLIQMGDKPQNSTMPSDSGYYPAAEDTIDADVTNGMDESDANQAIAALALEAQAQAQADLNEILDPRLFETASDPVVKNAEPPIDPALTSDQPSEPAQFSIPAQQSKPESGTILASPPNSLIADTIYPEPQEYALAADTITSSIEQGTATDLLDTAANNPLHTPQSTSRHSSRQPKAAAADNIVGTADNRGRSGSGSGSGRVGGGRGSTGEPDAEADEESLRLIRELQMEERGLRRRG